MLAHGTPPPYRSPLSHPRSDLSRRQQHEGEYEPNGRRAPSAAFNPVSPRPHPSNRSRSPHHGRQWHAPGALRPVLAHGTPPPYRSPLSHPRSDLSPVGSFARPGIFRPPGGSETRARTRNATAISVAAQPPSVGSFAFLLSPVQYRSRLSHPRSDLPAPPFNIGRGSATLGRIFPAPIFPRTCRRSCRDLSLRRPHLGTLSSGFHCSARSRAPRLQ